VDYRRVFWTCLALAGLLQFVQFAPTLLEGTGIQSVTTTLAAAVLVAVGGFGVAFPERAGGPERPGPLLYAAVLAVVLLFAGLVLS
jgi:hypothetical protein